MNIIDIANPDDLDYYGICPSEFVYLIHNASYICTVSFHSTVFSLLFHQNLVCLVAGIRMEEYPRYLIYWG